MNPKSNGFQFDSDKHLYWQDGRIVPSTTQTLRVVGIATDYSRANPVDVEWKRKLGSAFHKCLHFLALRDLDMTSVDPALLPFLEARQLAQKELHFKVLTTETPRCARLGGLWYGMTPDETWLMRGEPWLVDDKLIEGTPHPSWGVQLASYENGLDKPLIPPFHYRRASLQLFPNGKYNFEEFKDPGDIEEFKAALFLCWRKINRGAEPWKEQ